MKMEKQEAAMARILAVSSGGGHWEQLQIIAASFAGHEVFFANTIVGLAEKSGVKAEVVLADCNRNEPLEVLRCAWQAFTLVRRVRPDFVVSTGAAPGLFALLFGKLLGARTVWIDSVANSERLSMSGKIAGRFVDLQLTQWEYLSAGGKPAYMGSLL
jgi:UDP-N-acetylglucosamine:LPS N-acetylglucosamine transferase